MLASEVMTREVITIDPKTDVKEIVDLMIRHRISGLPVVDAQGRVLGIVSEGDLMRRVENDTERRDSWWLTALFAARDDSGSYIKSHARRAEDLMTRDPVTVGSDTPLFRIAQLLEKHHVKRVPVVDEGRLVGIISRSNLLQGFSATQTRAQASGSANDADIRHRIMDAMEERFDISGNMTNVVVQDGVVDLWGLVESDSQRKAAAILAEEVDGVKSVNNHLKILKAMPNPA
jgi:CBS domain-containing protein